MSMQGTVSPHFSINLFMARKTIRAKT